MGIQIRPEEYSVMMEMDRAFVYALRKELSEQMARESDKDSKQ